jgi:L-ascorbate metabolism protein UlaG (beta-lactamase superfamily)
VRVHAGLEVEWLGHAMFRIRTPGGKVVIIDPFVAGNPSYPQGAAPIDKADLVLVTHGHDDHMGDAAEIGRRTGAPVVGVFELSLYLGRQQGVQAVGMNKGSEARIAELGVIMTHAEHSSGFVDSDGRLVPGGEAVGYVLTLEDGYRLYHAGDTAVFGDMALIRDLWHPSLALLPIGGFFTMGPREAAHAARLLGVEKVIPMHYGTFPPLTGRPDALALELAGSGIEVVALNPGDRTEA